MTHPTNAPASPKIPLPPPPTDRELEERSRRARLEAMSVLALGEDLYEVESADGETYLVDLEAGRCTCPDHVFRGARCKHVRRVAIEITDGRTPPPGDRAVTCHDCAETVFVDEDAQAPFYCESHAIEPGDVVRDRETGDRLTVVDVSDRPAAEVFIPSADSTVADYPTNRAYGEKEPVVAAVYPHARLRERGPVPRSLRVYAFPRTRLVRAVE